MILQDVSLLASDTARTKAYLQMMVKEKLFPKKCLIYTNDFQKMRQEVSEYGNKSKEVKYFNLDEPVLWTIEQFGMDYIVVENKDINSDDLRKAITNLPSKYCIYSGYGGYILKPHLFQLDKKYVHVHAGILPEYRGSTTAYYSMLQEGYIGATSIFLSEGIDEGKIILSARFPMPDKSLNIDVLYEPWLRSQVLKMTMERLNENGELEGIEQSMENAQTYFIIHPVLKHLALMRLKG